MNNQLKRKLQRKSSEYFKNTTFHGVYYLYVKTHWFNRILWLGLIIISISLCACLCQVTWNKYSQNPTVTVVETTHYHTMHVPFPAVVVCDTMNFVFEPRTHNVTMILLKRGYNATMIDAFYETMTTFDLYHPLNGSISKMHAVLDDIGLPIKSLITQFSKPCDELLHFCRWRSVVYDCGIIFKPQAHHTGICCRFEVDYLKNYTKQNVSYHAGHEKAEGLQFMIKRPANVTDETQIKDRDVDIYIIPSDAPITVLDNPVLASPRTALNFVIQPWVIDSSDNVKGLSIDSRKCLLDTDYDAEASFYTGCISEGFHKDVIANCRCKPFYYNNDRVEAVPDCNWDDHACIYEAIDNIRGNMAEIAERFSCYPDCDHVEYEADVDFYNAMLGREDANKTIRNTDVMIHFASNSCLKYRRELLFTWDQLLASLGGLFGLCTGGSIISAIELIYYLIDIMTVLVVAYWRKNKQEPKNNKIIEAWKIKPADKKKNDERFDDQSKFSYNE